MRKRGARASASLYVLDEADSLGAGFAEEAVSYLPARRREKVFSYRFPADRTVSAAAYLLLRLLLKDVCGIDGPAVFLYNNDNGKPRLEGYPDIHFNLSHCHGAAACAVSDVPVGVDVQDIETVAAMEDGVARMALTAEEYKAYKLSARPEDFFCKVWVAKESFLKKTGMGIAVDLTMLPADSLGERTLFRTKDYYCCATGFFRPRLINAKEFRVMVTGLSPVRVEGNCLMSGTLSPRRAGATGF